MVDHLVRDCLVMIFQNGSSAKRSSSNESFGKRSSGKRLFSKDSFGKESFEKESSGKKSSGKELFGGTSCLAMTICGLGSRIQSFGCQFWTFFKSF